MNFIFLFDENKLFKIMLYEVSKKSFFDWDGIVEFFFKKKKIDWLGCLFSNDSFE